MISELSFEQSGAVGAGVYVPWLGFGIRTFTVVGIIKGAAAVALASRVCPKLKFAGTGFKGGVLRTMAMGGLTYLAYEAINLIFEY